MDRQRLAASPEGRILQAGLILALLYFVALVASWIYLPNHAPVLGAMTALNLVVGRAAGMSFAYAAGLDHAVVIPANLFVETIQVLLVYPLFVLSWRHLLEIRCLNRFMIKIRATAEKHHPIIRRYGVFGLFIFVLIPFWMTGPVVGAILGFLIGLRPWLNIGIVLGATAIAIVAWAVLLHGVQDWAATYSQYAPLGLAAALIALVLAWRFAQIRLQR